MTHVKKARMDAGLSLNQLARKLETSPNYISQIELGHKRPSIEMAKRLAGVLGFEWWKVFEDEEEG